MTTPSTVPNRTTQPEHSPQPAPTSTLFTAMRRVEEYFAIITGAASGIGLALTERLHYNGINGLFLVDMNHGTLKSLTARLNEQRPGTVAMAAVDLTSLQAPENVAKQAADFFRPTNPKMPTVLYNVAGIVEDQLFGGITEERLERTLKVNTIAPLLLAQACSKKIWKGTSSDVRGAVVNVTSVSSTVHLAGQAAYAASKAALGNLTVHCASELAGKGVVVNSVAPGFVRTPMTAELSQLHLQALGSAVPNGELFCDPAQIVDALIFAGFASFLNGAEIPVSNGLGAFGLATMHSNRLNEIRRTAKLQSVRETTMSDDL